MKKIEITENPYFDYLPHRRLGWYILIVIDLVSIFALAVSGELYLSILVILITLAVLPNLIKILKLRKSSPKSMQVTMDADRITYRYGEQEVTVDKNIIKAIIMSSDTSNGKDNMLINLMCKCDKKDKTLLKELPSSLFYGRRLKNLVKFLHSHLPGVELIFFDTAEI